MAFTHTILQKVTTGGNTLQSSKAYSEEAQASRSVPIASDASDFEIDFVCDVSEIESIYITADQDMLLEVNDGAGAGGSIALVAGIPYVWHTGSYYTNLLAVDITALFVTNTSDPATAGTFELEVLFHPTPP